MAPTCLSDLRSGVSPSAVSGWFLVGALHLCPLHVGRAALWAHLFLLHCCRTQKGMLPRGARLTSLFQMHCFILKPLHSSHAPPDPLSYPPPLRECYHLEYHLLSPSVLSALASCHPPLVLNALKPRTCWPQVPLVQIPNFRTHMTIRLADDVLYNP